MKNNFSLKIKLDTSALIDALNEASKKHNKLSRSARQLAKYLSKELAKLQPKKREPQITYDPSKWTGRPN